MLGRQIFKCHFGKHYKIHFTKDGPVPRSLKPERFSSAHSVRQFLLGLRTAQSYWRQLAVYFDDSVPYRSHQRDYLYVVANSVLSGRIRIFEVDVPDTNALAHSSTAIQDRQGYQYQFISMRQALASSSRSPQRFTSTQQVYETLYELAPNLEQLQALATELQLTSSLQQQTYTQLMDVLAEGLAEQRVALYVTAPFKRPEAAGAALEFASNMPGNRKVELAPVTPAGVANVRVVKPAAQSKINMRSVDDLMGVEPASPELISAVSKKRDVVIAEPGSEELRMLDYFGAEASVGGVDNTHILLRPNPSKAALLEEFLHGTQTRLGITDRLGTSGMGSAETHVKDFMIRHKKILGLGDEDVQILQILRDKGL